jgi:hypothetical protein
MSGETMLRRAYTLLLSLVFALALKGQTENQIIGFKLDNDANKTSFSFDLINNLVIIPVLLNDSIKLNFILDTGVRTTLLTNNESGILNLRDNRQVVVEGLGLTREIRAFVVPNVKLQLPGITGFGQTLIALGEDYLKLQNHLGREVHGILGYDFFNHFVVRINYGAKRISVYKHGFFKPQKNSTFLNLTIIGGKPFVQASLTQLNGQVVSGNFLVDTGASHSLLLETERTTDVYLPVPNLPTIIGYGLGGEVRGNLARIQRFDLGKYTLKKVIASYGSGLYRSTSDSLIGRIGSIGGELMSRFTATFDYRNRLLYLKPNNSFRKSFDYNMSSIDVVAEGKDFKTFTIVNVNPYSAAWYAGLRPDDVVLAVNERGAGELDLEQINAIFRSHPGAVIQLLVRRDKKVFTVRFRLKRLI